MGAAQPIGGNSSTRWSEATEFSAGRISHVPPPTERPAVERNQRAHLIRRLQSWADARRQYRLKLGERVIGFDHLTDDALADLAVLIAGDVWRKRRLNRENRRRHAAPRGEA